MEGGYHMLMSHLRQRDSDRSATGCLGKVKVNVYLYSASS